MGGRALGKGHEVAGSDLDASIADQRDAPAFENEYKLLVLTVEMMLRRVASRLDPHQMHTHIGQAQQVPQRACHAHRVRVELVHPFRFSKPRDLFSAQVKPWAALHTHLR